MTLLMPSPHWKCFLVLDFLAMLPHLLKMLALLALNLQPVFNTPMSGKFQDSAENRDNEKPSPTSYAKEA